MFSNQSFFGASASSSTSDLDSNFQHTARLLQSIASAGLTGSGGAAAIKSIHGSSPIFCYNHVDFGSLSTHHQKALFDETVNALVFNAKEGLWGIASERFNLSSTHAFSDAVLNSVVFVFDSDVTDNTYNARRREPGNLRLCGADAVGRDENHNYFHEVKARGDQAGILPQHIKAILAPLHLFEVMKLDFPNALVVPVTTEMRTISNPVFLQDKTIMTQPVLGLNYARALQIALAERMDLDTIGVHLTRFPKSFKTNPALSLEENKASYTALYGTEKTCFRLTQLSAEKIEAIKAVESVLLLKEHRLSSNYLCYCPASTKDQVHEIVTRSAAPETPLTTP